MATEVDLQRLVVQMEASFTKYQREWQKALGVTDTNVTRVQKRFDGMSRTIANQGRGAARGMQPVLTETGNVAAQFQDIAVQLSQPGTSPFLIAMQQGTQLSAILGQSRNPVKALAAGFMGMINPVSLVTIGVIALGGAAIQWLTRTEEGVKETEDALQSHLTRIKEITRGYEDAEQAARDYVEENQRLPQAVAESDLERQREAALASLGEIIDQVREKQAWLNSEIEFFEETGLDPAIIAQLQTLSNVITDAGLSSDSSKAEIDALLTALRAIGDTTALPDIRDIVDELEALLRQAADARVEVGSLEAALNELPEDVQIRVQVSTNFSSAMEELRDLAPELRSSAEVARAAANDAFQRASINAQSISELNEAVSQYEQTLAAINEQERRRNETSGGGGGGGSSGAQAERDAVAELIAELQHEFDILGMTEQQQEIANALRRAGAEATDEQRQKIIGLIQATQEEETRIQALQQLYSELGNIGEGAIRGIVNALSDGKIEAREFQSILSNVISMVANAGLNLLFGGIGGLFGGGGGLFGLFDKGGYTGNGGKYQPAGIVHAGEYVFSKEAVQRAGVGNLEAMHRNLRGYASGGLVMPAMPAPMGMGGSQPIRIALEVQEGAAFETRVLEVSGPASAEITSRSIRSYDRNLSANMSNHDARYR